MSEPIYAGQHIVYPPYPVEFKVLNPNRGVTVYVLVKFLVDGVDFYKYVEQSVLLRWRLEQRLREAKQKLAAAEAQYKNEYAEIMHELSQLRD